MIVILKMLSTFLTTRIIMNLAKVCGYGPSDKVNPPERQLWGILLCCAVYSSLYSHLLAAGRVNINLRTPKCASIRCLAGHQNTVIGGQRSFVSQICDSARHSLHLGPAVIFSYIWIKKFLIIYSRNIQTFWRIACYTKYIRNARIFNNYPSTLFENPKS